MDREKVRKELNPCLEFTEDSYIVGMWLIPVGPHLHPPNGGDIMACLYKDKITDTRWKMMHRHRYDHDGGKVKFLDSKDRKSVYHASCEGEEEKVRAEFHAALMAIAAAAGVSIEDQCNAYFEIKGSHEKMIKLAMAGKAPRWFNLQTVSNKPPA